MGVRAPEQEPGEADVRGPAPEPARLATAVLALLILAALLANGRPSVGEPPHLSPSVRALLPGDDASGALAGKAVASIFAALAAAALFVAAARKSPETDAAFAAAVLALGTPVWGASQALWPQAVSVFFVSVALLFLARAEDDPAWAGRAGVPLGLSVAANPAAVALVVVLGAAAVVRWPRRSAWLLGYAALSVLAGRAARGSLASSPAADLAGRFAEPFGPGQLALLASPGKGILVFAPVVVIALAGMLVSWRYGERWRVASAGLAVLAHGLLAGCARDWASGEAWGPRHLADAMPLVLVFLPDGFARLGGLGRVVAVLSVAVQALGAFGYDDRWVQLEQRPPAPGHAEVWRASTSPLALYAGRRVLILAAPGLADGRLAVRTHPVVLSSAEGSRVEFADDGPVVGGSPAALRDVYLLGGARVVGGRLGLKRPPDGIFLRVAESARARPLELRVAGRGRGAIQVGEGGFWNPSPRWRSHAVSGSFLVRHPYRYPESGGPDLRLVPAAGTDVEIEWVALVAPSDPVNPIPLQPRSRTVDSPHFSFVRSTVK